MKAILFNFVVGVLLLGCVSCANNKNVALPPITAVGTVEIRNNLDKPLPVGDITDKVLIKKMMDFVNSLPQQWSVPWYGPPVGKIYFNFYRGGKMIGNFYVGPNFFGRDASYGNGSFEFYSQTATDNQVQELNEIVGFDIGKYVQAP